MSFKSIKNSFIQWIKRVNPFLFLTAGFLISIVIPGDYSVWNQLKYDRELNKQAREIQQLERKIYEVKAAKEELKLENDRLEKFARERYLMKEEDEDIYLIEE